MAFLAPAIAELAGSVAGPALESAIGGEVAQKLAPLAKKGLEHIVTEKNVGGLFHKLGNHFFGKKNKSARKLMQKGRSIAGVAFGKNAHKILGTGLNIGKGLGVLSDDQANQILSGHQKAMSIHDKLSEFNKKHDVLSTGKTKKPSKSSDAHELSKLEKLERKDRKRISALEKEIM